MARMNINKIEKQIAGVLRDLFLDKGFIYQKEEKCFVNREGDLVRHFSLGVSRSGSKIVVAPTLAVAFESVKNIYNLFSGIPLEAQSNYSTVITTLVKLGPDKERGRYFVSSEKDVDEVSRHLLDDVNNLAVPFFKEFGTLQSIDQSLNGSEAITIFDARGWSRYANAIIVSSLLDDPGLGELITTNREIVAKFDRGFYLEKYDRLSEFLTNNVEPE